MAAHRPHLLFALATALTVAFTFAITPVAAATTTTTTESSSANPSLSGQSVTLTAVVTPTPPDGETATFLDGGSSIGTGTLSSGTAQLTTSSLAVGSHVMTVSYPGDATLAPSTGALTGGPQVVDNDTMSLSSSLNPAVYGQSVVFTATIVAVPSGACTPAGTVTFLDGTFAAQTVTLSGGLASFNTIVNNGTSAQMNAGNHVITATYAGGGGCSPLTSSLTGNPMVVSKASSTTALTIVPPATGYFGQAICFFYTLTAVAPGGGVPPLGLVDFWDNGTFFGQQSGGGFLCDGFPGLQVGTHTITANYLGNNNYDPSSATVANYVVLPGATQTTVATSANPITYGQSVTLTASVVNAAPGACPPSGTVTFFAGAASLGTSPLIGGSFTSAGTATLTTPAIPAGNASITATYNGSTDCDPSTGTLASNPEVVIPDATTTTLSSSGVDSVTGQLVTLTAQVTPNAPGSGTPSGLVTFFDGSTVLGTGSVSADVATLVTGDLTPGKHIVTASYGGDSDFDTSASGPLTLTVVADTTTIAVSISPNPSSTGQVVSIVVTVKASPPGSGNPTGNVTVLVDGKAVADVTLDSSVDSRATYSTSSLSAGSHAVTAQYSGDAGYLGSRTANVETADVTPAISVPATGSSTPTGAAGAMILVGTFALAEASRGRVSRRRKPR